MRVAIVAIGSAGDVHPFVAIGRCLRERGHDVVIHASAWYEDAVRHAGLSFEPMDTRERFLEITKRPELWDSRRGFPFIMREAVLATLRLVYEKLEADVRAGAMLVGSSLDVAGRLLEEKYRVPRVTVHVSPAILRTAYRVPVFKGAGFVRRMPHWFKRGFWWFSDRIFDPTWVPQLNAFRKEIGLSDVKRPMNGWWQSSARVLGCWPEWYAPFQPDWPAQLRLTGFPFYDRGLSGALDPALEQWIAEGSKPVVFTHGSANVQGRAFFAASLRACERLGVRGLFVTSEREDVPSDLPAGVRHESYVPFGLLLPRAAALVSHGGMGTIAQGLRAGIPQLVVAMAHDQHDNGSRLDDLGAGRWIDAAKFSPEEAGSLLREVLHDDGIMSRAASCAERIAREDGPKTAAEEILAVARATPV